MAPLIFGSIAFLHNYTDSTKFRQLHPKKVLTVDEILIKFGIRMVIRFEF